jgi:bifunctional pyridoxal-dependent enzyme with beta-cystathionase and maltose regulon repressor activities
MVALTQFCEGCVIRKHHKASYKLDITKEQSQVPSLLSMGTFVAYAKGFTWWSMLLFYIQR